MASQNRLFGRSLLCQSITKFSHSTLPRNASPSGWSHIEAQDLCLLIEYLQHENDIQLRVVQGTNDLEVLPLSSLIQETKELHQRYPTRSPDSLPVFGLTKGTALAIRYFCQDNQVRRIQARFSDEAACNETVKLLSHHGMMFSIPSSTKQTGLSSQLRPGTGDSYASRIIVTSPTHTSQSTPSAINVPSVHDAYNFSTNNAAQNTERPYSSKQPTSSYSGFATSPCPPEQNTHRQPSFAPIRTSMEPEHRRPTTADTIKWPSDMTRDLLPPRRELPFPRPSTASSSSSRTLPPLPKPKYASDSTSKTTTSPGQYHIARNQVSRLATPRGPTRFEPPSSRMYNFQQNQSGVGQAPINYDQDAMQVDEVEYRASSPSCSSPGTARQSNYSPQPSSPQRDEHREKQFTSSPLHFGSSSVHTSSSQHTLIPQHTSDPQNSPASPQHNPTFQNIPQKHPSPSRQPLRTPQSTVNNDRYFSIPSQQENVDILRDYTAQNQQTRIDDMNKFIVENINNPDFLTLCVDVEACWRRKVLDRRD